MRNLSRMKLQGGGCVIATLGINQSPVHKTTFQSAYYLLMQILQKADIQAINQDRTVFNVECDNQLFENLCSFDAEIADREDDFDFEDGHDREEEYYF